MAVTIDYRVVSFVGAQCLICGIIDENQYCTNSPFICRTVVNRQDMESATSSIEGVDDQHTGGRMEYNTLDFRYDIDH
jgi:hypothetical protein